MTAARDPHRNIRKTSPPSRAKDHGRVRKTQPIMTIRSADWKQVDTAHQPLASLAEYWLGCQLFFESQLRVPIMPCISENTCSNFNRWVGWQQRFDFSTLYLLSIYRPANEPNPNYCT